MDRQDLVRNILNLDVLSYQISLEDLEQYLGMAIVFNDRVKLQRC